MSDSGSSLHPPPSSSSTSSTSDQTGTRRRRSSSVKQVVNYLVSPPKDHHLQHLQTPPTQLHDLPTPLPTNLNKKPRKEKVKQYGPKWLRWIQNPGDSFLVLGTIVSLYCAWETLLAKSTDWDNPFKPFLFISYPLPAQDDGITRYRKGYKDVLFLLFWVVGFSFLRQGLTIWLVKPLGIKLGLKKNNRKLERFMEQGYAVIYFGFSSIAGLIVMKSESTWFFQTKYFWLDYPHWDMTGWVKWYYLTQFAYWLQQALVMLAKLEKPRDDYIELVLHHIITLWLIGASYFVNLTRIGVCVFVSMDIPDFLLAISKCISYLSLETLGNFSFIVFMINWGYFRHYQNIRILNSVWKEFELIPAQSRVWDIKEGLFMPGWMRYQIFLPIAALQFVIAFWSYLILRIVFRMILGRSASDVREENESGIDDNASDFEGKRSRANSSSSLGGGRRRDSTTVNSGPGPGGPGRKRR